ncbi:cupin domain-containing protein [Hyunsoonleella rubra]|uniref:Cupin domain-containing protein n=1 Tax=Hyunsoonleella rubra TaxID=1737062 RepID=A0ABW5TD15_9FLAO
MTEQVQHIIEALGLNPHPEGGHFKETYRSEGIIYNENLGNSFTGDRNYCTAIYFLLTSDAFSAFHRIKQDEMWHFYKGSPLLLHMISEEGVYSKVEIGNNLEKGEVPQFVVPAKYYFAVEVIEADSYALAGCTVSPGFDFHDFDMPSQNVLIERFPEHMEVIAKLTRT